jgi:hypothetical protein
MKVGEYVSFGNLRTILRWSLSLILRFPNKFFRNGCFCIIVKRKPLT